MISTCSPCSSLSAMSCQAEAWVKWRSNADSGFGTVKGLQRLGRFGGLPTRRVRGLLARRASSLLVSSSIPHGYRGPAITLLRAGPCGDHMIPIWWSSRRCARAWWPGWPCSTVPSAGLPACCDRETGAACWWLQAHGHRRRIDARRLRTAVALPEPRVEPAALPRGVRRLSRVGPGSHRIPLRRRRREQRRRATSPAATGAGIRRSHRELP